MKDLETYQDFIEGTPEEDPDEDFETIRRESQRFYNETKSRKAKGRKLQNFVRAKVLKAFRREG